MPDGQVQKVCHNRLPPRLPNLTQIYLPRRSHPTLLQPANSTQQVPTTVRADLERLAPGAVCVKEAQTIAKYRLPGVATTLAVRRPLLIGCCETAMGRYVLVSRCCAVCLLVSPRPAPEKAPTSALAVLSPCRR